MTASEQAAERISGYVEECDLHTLREVYQLLFGTDVIYDGLTKQIEGE